MCTEFFTNTFGIFELVVLILSFVLYILSFQFPQNEMHIPPKDPNANFPKSTELKFYENVLYMYVLFFPLVLLVLKIICICLTTKKIRNFKYFPCVWISLTSVFLSLSIANCIRNMVGYPKPDTFFACGYDFHIGKCQKKLTNKFTLFISYPSFESVIIMSIAMNLVSIFQFVFPLFNIPCIVFLFLGIYFGTNTIKHFNSHPEDVSAALFVGFLVTNFIWNNAKNRISVKVEQNYTSMYY